MANIRKSESAIDDFRLCLKNYNAWLHLAQHDVRARYRRTFLGPWWIVLGMTITLGLMGIVWSAILGLEWKTYLPFMIIGLIVWYWISDTITQSCNVLAVEFSGAIQTSALPPLIFLLRFVTRGFLLHLHYMSIYAVVILVTATEPSWKAIFFVPFAMAIVLVNTFFVAITLSILGARLRDLGPLVSAVMSPMMLLTPVIWKPDMLGSLIYLADFNLFTHFIEIFRNPLLGQGVDGLTWAVVFATTVINMGVGTLLYCKYRDHIVFWV